MQSATQQAPNQEESSGVSSKPSSKFSKTVKNLSYRWFIEAFTGMAFGLFATLIAGTIFVQIGTLIGVDNRVGLLLDQIGRLARIMMGAGIGAGMAHQLKANKLVTAAAVAAGFIGANASGFGLYTAAIGNPIGAYMAALLTIEVCSLISGKTKLDIIVIPLSALILTTVVVIVLCPPVNYAISLIARGLAASVAWSPAFMGIIIAVVMGFLLTSPASSAAIWVMICGTGTLSPELLLAGGAAVVGCAAHMVGFAAISYKDNGFSGVIAQGLGTSMLQIPNFIKNPKILIPPIVASAVVGPLATAVFKLKCGATGGGMGTSGLVGVFSTIENSAHLGAGMLTLAIILLFFVLPAAVSLAVWYPLRHIGWIRDGDMKIGGAVG
jgi:hypothetical protein